jgi:hypothetical protein
VFFYQISSDLVGLFRYPLADFVALCGFGLTPAHFPRSESAGLFRRAGECPGLGDIDLQEPGLPWFNIRTEAVIELDVGNTGIEGLWGIESYNSLRVLDASANSLLDIWPLFSVPEMVQVDLRENTSIPCDQLDQLELMLGADAVLRPVTCVLRDPLIYLKRAIKGYVAREWRTGSEPVVGWGGCDRPSVGVAG